jgi:ATP-dependent Clp protease ATP-binding subunit ClpA
LEVTSSAKRNILDEGSDPQYGARPMKRHIQRSIETKIAKYILENNPPQDSTLIVDFESNAYSVKIKNRLN